MALKRPPSPPPLFSCFERTGKRAKQDFGARLPSEWRLPRRHLRVGVLAGFVVIAGLLFTYQADSVYQDSEKAGISRQRTSCTRCNFDGRYRFHFLAENMSISFVTVEALRIWEAMRIVCVSQRVCSPGYQPAAPSSLLTLAILPSDSSLLYVPSHVLPLHWSLQQQQHCF